MFASHYWYHFNVNPRKKLYILHIYIFVIVDDLEKFTYWMKWPGLAAKNEKFSFYKDFFLFKAISYKLASLHAVDVLPQ